MIASTSVFIIRWLAPLLFLTSIFLSVFSFVGPVPTFNNVALISVTPMNVSNGAVMSQRSLSVFDEVGVARRVARAGIAHVLAAKVQGATVLVGPLGSCAKKNNEGKLSCQRPVWFPTYSYDFLPDNAPKSALPPSPPSSTVQIYFASLVLSVLFFLLTLINLLAETLPKVPTFLNKMNTNNLVTRIITSIGMMAFVMGMLASVVWRVSFGRDVQEFNVRIYEANGNPALFAQLSNGFTMMWVAFAFQVPSLVCQLFKLHIQALAMGAVADKA